MGTINIIVCPVRFPSIWRSQRRASRVPRLLQKHQTTAAGTTRPARLRSRCARGCRATRSWCAPHPNLEVFSRPGAGCEERGGPRVRGGKAPPVPRLTLTLFLGSRRSGAEFSVLSFTRRGRLAFFLNPRMLDPAVGAKVTSYFKVTSYCKVTSITLLVTLK